MIDPDNITNFNRTDSELEEFLLFTICVAGKKAHEQARKLEEFLWLGPHGRSPFRRLRWMNTSACFPGGIEGALRKVRMGQYARIGGVFACLARKTVNPRTVTLEELESIPGIGSKTSRFFLVHSRPDQRLAVLDRHILRHLREAGVDRVPDNTPRTQKDYRRLEEEFLRLADAQGCPVHQLDLQLWKERRSPARVNGRNT